MADLKDYGFPFNSIGGDRTYNASVFRDYFKLLLDDGILEGFTVEQNATPNKTVQLNEGRVFIQGIGFEIATPVSLTVADNISGNPRIDRVVLRVDYTARLVSAEILQGTPAVSPVAPDLTRDTGTWELSVAQILLANGFSTILNASITDERLDESVCGFSKTVGQAEFENENDLLKYNRDVETVDASGNPTDIRYKRPSNNSLFLKRFYSNPDTSGRYQTITETFYLDNGITVYKTIVYTLTYFANGIVDTMTRVVS